MEHVLGLNPAAPPHLPSFIVLPGEPDRLMTFMAVFLVVAMVSVGLVYLKLHALPEHMAHRANRVQLQVVAVLGLLSLLTHNALFWIAGLLLALIELPSFSTPMNSIALSLERLSGRDREAGAPDVLSEDLPAAPPPADHPARKA